MRDGVLVVSVFCTSISFDILCNIISRHTFTASAYGAFGASHDMGLPNPPANDEIAVSMPAYIPMAQFAMAATKITIYTGVLDSRRSRKLGVKHTRSVFRYQYFLKPRIQRDFCRQVSTRLEPGTMPGVQGPSAFMASSCIQWPTRRMGGNV